MCNSKPASRRLHQFGWFAAGARKTAAEIKAGIQRRAAWQLRAKRPEIDVHRPLNRLNGSEDREEDRLRTTSGFSPAAGLRDLLPEAGTWFQIQLRTGSALT